MSAGWHPINLWATLSERRVVLLVDFLVDHNQGACLDGLLLGDGLYLGDRIHLVDDALVVGLDDLGAVVPVGLVAVVLGRIVGGGYHYAGVAAQGSDGVGQFRGGTQTGEQVGLEAVGGEDAGGGLGEDIGCGI